MIKRLLFVVIILVLYVIVLIWPSEILTELIVENCYNCSGGEMYIQFLISLSVSIILYIFIFVIVKIIAWIIGDEIVYNAIRGIFEL